MHEQDMDVSLKVIVVGNGMVGKTSMITRFARGVMTDNYKKTIGTGQLKETNGGRNKRGTRRKMQVKRNNDTL
jgi:GTPase SAR1 family protein